MGGPKWWGKFNKIELIMWPVIVNGLVSVICYMLVCVCIVSLSQPSWVLISICGIFCCRDKKMYKGKNHYLVQTHTSYPGHNRFQKYMSSYGY